MGNDTPPMVVNFIGLGAYFVWWGEHIISPSNIIIFETIKKKIILDIYICYK